MSRRITPVQQLHERLESLERRVKHLEEGGGLRRSQVPPDLLWTCPEHGAVIMVHILSLTVRTAPSRGVHPGHARA